MRKNDKKQKKSLMFSTAVVITGCIATAVYVNQTMNTATDYKVDLSQLSVSEEKGTSLANDPELNSGVSLARVSGKDVVNEIPTEDEKQTSENRQTSQAKQTSENRQTSQAKQASEDRQTPEKKENKTSNEKKATAADLSFSAQDGMGWPVVGDVILNYSMDSAVYFSTLEQYKYNPAILIGAQQGTNVSACAKGQVTKIGKNNEIGQYVVMNLGNGYEVTYGQLEQLQVKEGNAVSRGQVIGTVAKTTKYYSVEGDHMYLMITKDGEPVNPLSLLQ